MPEGMIATGKSFAILNIASLSLIQSKYLNLLFSFPTLYLLFHWWNWAL